MAEPAMIIGRVPPPDRANSTPSITPPATPAPAPHTAPVPVETASMVLLGALGVVGAGAGAGAAFVAAGAVNGRAWGKGRTFEMGAGMGLVSPGRAGGGWAAGRGTYPGPPGEFD